MPNARVGAMPQPPHTQGDHPPPYNHHGGRGRGRQGISMEDLKKQTAIRLAQEQQRRRGTDEEGTEVDDQCDPHAHNLSQRSDTCHSDRFPQHQQQTMSPYQGFPHPYHSQNGQHDKHFKSHGCDSQALPPDVISGGEHYPAPSHGDHDGRISHDGASELMTPTRRGERPFLPLPPSPCARSTQEQHNTPRSNHYTRSSEKREPQRKPPDGRESPNPQRHQHVSPSPRKFDSRVVSSFVPNSPPKQYQSREQYQPRGRGVKLHQRNGCASGSTSFEASGAAPGSSPSTSGTNKQNKLPHGLTVQELKEMTRARLAGSSDSGSVGSIAVEEEFQRNQQQLSRGGVLPQSFTPNRSRLGSSGSTGSRKRESRQRHSQPLAPYSMRQRTASMESTASAPPAVVHTPQHDRGGAVFHRTFSHHAFGDHHTAMVGPDHGGGGAFHQGHMLVNPPTGHIGTPQKGKQIAFSSGKDPRQSEVLETASVTSLNSALGSEYLGSESSAFNPGVMQRGSGAENDSAIPFSRSLSYPAGASVGNSMEDPLQHDMAAVNANSTYFDPSVGMGMGMGMGMNRQRAATDPSGFGSVASNRLRTATMSPPGLSHLMEHEPLNIAGTGGDELCIPTFDSLSPQNQGPHTGLSAKIVEFSTSPSGSRVSSPTNSRMGNNSSCGGFFPDGGLSDIFQRPQSATPAGDGVSSNEARTGIGLLSSVFRSVASFGGDDPSSRAPGGELTISSTVSSGGAFFSDVERRVLGAKSWGGPTCNGDQAAQAHHGRDDPLTTSMLGRDLDALLSFSDQPGQGSEDAAHVRAPSLVSKIDPELKTSGKSNDVGSASASGLSVLSPNDPILPISDKARSSGCGGAVGQV